MYQNKRTGVMAKLVSMNDKFKTVTLEKENGDTFDVTTSTFKRWWGKVKEEDTNVAGDGTSYTEVMQEIVKQAEEKAEKATSKAPAQPDIVDIMEAEVTKLNTKPAKKEKKSRAKKENTPAEFNPDILATKDFITGAVQAIGGELFYPEKAPNVVAFKVDGHMFGRINFSRKRITLCLRRVAVYDVKIPEKDINHLFDAGYTFITLSDEDKELINKLMVAARDHQVAKKAAVKTKKEGKKNGENK